MVFPKNYNITILYIHANRKQFQKGKCVLTRRHVEIQAGNSQKNLSSTARPQAGVEPMPSRCRRLFRFRRQSDTSEIDGRAPH